MKPLVSVIIPTCNRNNIVPRAIESALKQTYTNIEIIIVDDSKNGEFKKIESTFLNREQIQIYYSYGKGACAARNLGIVKAKGEYVAFLDDDDEFLPDKISQQLNFMKTNDYRISYTWSHIIDRINNSMTYMPRYSGNILSWLLVYNFIGTQTLMIRKDILSESGFFDENLKQNQDWDLVIRLAKNNKIGLVKSPLVKIYQHNEDRISNSNDLMVSTAIIFNKYKSLERSIVVFVLQLMYSLKNKIRGRFIIYLKIVWLNKNLSEV